MKNPSLKQRLKQKRRIILKYLLNIFSFAKVQEHFYLEKYIIFFLFIKPSIHNKIKVTGYSFYELFVLEIFELLGGNTGYFHVVFA